jgi:hypothetical protein
MTYGDLTREQIDKLVSNPEYMRKLKETYDRKMAEFNKAVDEDLACIINEQIRGGGDT